MLRFRHIAFVVAAGSPRFYSFVVPTAKKIRLNQEYYVLNIENPPNIDSGRNYLFGDGDVVTFRRLGVCDSLANALDEVSKPNATCIQSLSYEPITQGKDCIIGAETGILILLSIIFLFIFYKRKWEDIGVFSSHISKVINGCIVSDSLSSSSYNGL